MKKIVKKLLPFLGLSLVLAGCSKLDKVNSLGISGDQTHFDYRGNFIQPELKIDGVADEPEWSGENVSETLTFTSGSNIVSVKMLRGEQSLFFYFEVSDTKINSVGNNNGDDVSFSDSVEFYIDSKNDGGNRPRNDDYQINLGVNGRTRILVGTGTEWNQWNGLCQYEVVINGTLNNNNDIDRGYTVEAMLPWEQINCNKNSSFGVAFGCVDKKTDDPKETVDWGGVVFEGALAEPQTPSNYFTYTGNTFTSRPYIVIEQNFNVLVNDEGGNPISGASVKYKGQTYNTDSNGLVKFGKVNPTENIELEISNSGYKTKKYTVKASQLVAAEGEYTYVANMIAGSGDDTVTLNYTVIGQTFEKFVYIKKFESCSLSVSRDDPLGLYLKVTSSGTSFDEFQRYEVYVDTGTSSRTTTDLNTYSIAFMNNKVLSVSKSPKVLSTRYPGEYATGTFNANVAEIFVPYSLLEADTSTEIGLSFGLWDNEVEDWSPMSRDGIESRVEYPNEYVRVSADGSIVDYHVKATAYDFDADTRSYVNLGTFSGKKKGAVQFSKFVVEADHSNSEYFALRLTTDQEQWVAHERLELYFDTGDASRTKRDALTYQMIVSCAAGVITSFKSYAPSEPSISSDTVKVYMDEQHMLITIPYTLIGTTSSGEVGLSFGCFNLVASDFDGYAYSNVYIDPEKPNLYVRVYDDNTIG